MIYFAYELILFRNACLVDGWYRTGGCLYSVDLFYNNLCIFYLDIGVKKNGDIFVIDRMKSVFKLVQGEFVSYVYLCLIIQCLILMQPREVRENLPKKSLCATDFCNSCTFSISRGNSFLMVQLLSKF